VGCNILLPANRQPSVEGHNSQKMPLCIKQTGETRNPQKNLGIQFPRLLSVPAAETPVHPINALRGPNSEGICPASVRVFVVAVLPDCCDSRKRAET